MNRKGYTIPELIVVISVLGIISLITLIKTSYAFSDTVTKHDENNYYLIEKQAEVYGTMNKDIFKDKNEIIILGKDLADAKLLPVDEDGSILSSDKDLSKVKIKLTLKGDNITAKIIK